MEQSTEGQQSLLDTTGQSSTEGQQSLLDTTGQNSSPSSDLVFPDKYAVRLQDGTVDVNASTAKLLEGYNNIAKKMGETGGLLPDSPDNYKIEFDAEKLGIPSSISAESLKKDEGFQEFLKGAHEAGITNEQINFITKQYLQHTQKMVDSKLEMDANSAQEVLSKLWGESNFEKNLATAQTALNAFTSPEERKALGGLANDPKFIDILNRVGQHLGEDKPSVRASQAGGRESIESLMRSEAYLDPNHADHNRVHAEVKAHYQKTYGSGAI